MNQVESPTQPKPYSTASLTDFPQVTAHDAYSIFAQVRTAPLCPVFYTLVAPSSTAIGTQESCNWGAQSVSSPAEAAPSYYFYTTAQPAVSSIFNFSFFAYYRMPLATGTFLYLYAPSS